jgi:hypothetical protein
MTVAEQPGHDRAAEADDLAEHVRCGVGGLASHRS